MSIPDHVFKQNLIMSYRDNQDVDALVEGIYILGTRQVLSDLCYDILQSNVLLKVAVHIARENFVNRRVDTDHLNGMLLKKRTLEKLCNTLVNETYR